MASFIHVLKKMSVSEENHKVWYKIFREESTYVVNEWIGQPITINFTGAIFCQDCGKKTPKSYSGFCYVCNMKSPLNSECILFPERCEAHLGKGRDPLWEEEYHHKPHIVYLANSGGLKVGVTRLDQIPTRWIDQGADETIILARVPYRRLAGEIEVFAKKFLSDKTNWRTMLKNKKLEGIDLLLEKNKCASTLPSEFKDYVLDDNTTYSFQYPSPLYEGTINSLKLDTSPNIGGVLVGIKGQYLIFDGGKVFNIRSHTGYQVEITCPNTN